VTLSGIEPAISRFVTQFLNRPSHRLPPLQIYTIRPIYTELSTNVMPIRKIHFFLFSFLLPCNIINFTLKYQLIAHYFNTLCKTHAKICRSNSLKFISLLHVSILKDHHQGVNVPIYEVTEGFLFLLILLVWWRHTCNYKTYNRLL